MIVSPATALATAVPIDRQGVAPPHVGPSVPVLETWSVMDRAVAGIASAIARAATAGRRGCLIKVLARNMFRAPLGSLSCGRASLATGRWPGDCPIPSLIPSHDFLRSFARLSIHLRGTGRTTHSASVHLPSRTTADLGI